MYVVPFIIVGFFLGFSGFPDGWNHATAFAVSVLGIPIMAWISAAVSARRWHDFDKSGWWALLTFVPVVGTIVIIVLGCIPGSPGDNRFGRAPTIAAAAL
jgi:uncharacterized membrane protein YhaH (DUF805 family)